MSTDKKTKTFNYEIPLHNKTSFDKRLRSRRHIFRSFEAKENSKRSFSEKIADYLTQILGSMAFLIGNAVWFVSWFVLNLNLIPGIKPFDPFPFGLLTMVVSLEAIFLSIIVLIAQNRSSKIDKIREEIELQIDTIAEEEITKMIQLQVLLLKKNGIDVTKDEEIKLMIEPLNQERVERSIEQQLKD